jgi:predicted dehydrogenase
MGSIGQRHAQCLGALGVRDLVAWRSRLGTMRTLGPELGHVREVSTMDDFFSTCPDAVIVATPTSLHVDHALAALERGCRVFIEKPIATTARDASRLAPFASQLVVGYCMRFSGVYRRVRELVHEGRLGRIARAAFRRSEYLPFWHPRADYRTEYAARKDLGGGVVRTMSHEIDLMRYLFGPVVGVAGAIDRVSNLEVDVDDTATFSCRLQSGARVSFDLDFLSPLRINRCEIIGSAGLLDLSFERQALTVTGYDLQTRIEQGADLFDFALMYQQQMADFVKFAEGGTSENCSYRDGLAVLDVVDALASASDIPVQPRP